MTFDEVPNVRRARPVFLSEGYSIEMEWVISPRLVIFIYRASRG